MHRFGTWIVQAIAGLIWAAASAAAALAATAPAASPEGGATSLQALVDATPAGEELRLSAGRYAGRVSIRRPIVIDGGGHAVIDGGGKGSVITIRGTGVTIRGLQITNSGETHDTIDAGVTVRGDQNVIEENVIDDCLFGIDLGQSNGNVIRKNQIHSKPFEMGVRGDGIRLWYSRDNQIVDNVIQDVRDVVVWYSGDNLIARNSVERGRYALHFMYSDKNRVEDNRFTKNMVGVFLMYSDGVELRGNVIREAVGATGMGIGFKESSNVVVSGNSIIGCAKGIYLDISPYEPDTHNWFLDNRIAFNSVGVVFHSDWHGNVFRGNDFEGNHSQVTVQGGGGAAHHEWSGNRWDDYRGFDRDGDGVGDQDYELYAYADRFWIDRPEAAFLRGSPLFEMIDFLDRLAPFTEPTLVVRDASPRFELDRSAIEAGDTRRD